MPYTLRVRADAEADLLNACQWYEHCERKLGDQFLAEVEKCLDLIESNPALFPRVYKEVHRAFCKRFPYGIFYIVEDGVIMVIAVFHAKRDPRTWQNRR